MMDISYGRPEMRGPAIDEACKAQVNLESEKNDSSQDTLVEEDRFRSLKRSLDEVFLHCKKRRKQLKPNKIPSNLGEMVQVPKQIVGLNIDIDNVNNSVPHSTKTSPIDDVHFENENRQCTIEQNDSSSSRASPDTGPSYVTPPGDPSGFMFPFHLQPVRWGQSCLKIFNQEAYCELCKKEFCNKYFLKTHKANKHGIYSECSGARKERPVEDGRHSSESDCDEKTRAFCDLCNKRFCNKYFVRRHKTKSHGFPEEGVEPEPIVQTNDSTKETVSTLDMAGPLALVKKEVEETDNQEGEEEGPLNLIVNTEEGEEKEEKDEVETSENLEKLQTMLLRLNPGQEPPEELEVKREYLSEHNDSSSESKAELEKQEADRPREGRQAKPTSSYCEICNKELCNKYFMRTHMQRMHGIELEHGAQIGGVVCNICNKELCSKYFLRVHKQNTHGILMPGALPAAAPPPRPSSSFSQTCYICNKRFRSAKWLQAHLLSEHREELDDDEEPGPALRIPRQPPRDTRDSPPDLPDPPEPLSVISKLFWENNPLSTNYTCSQCPFSTSVLAFLFVHERSHFVPPPDTPPVTPSASLQNLIHDKTFWQHKITQQVPECLDLSLPMAKPQYISFDQNGS